MPRGRPPGSKNKQSARMPRLVSERFRPQFLFTLDQIAMILAVPEETLFEYVWTPHSSSPPSGRMQAVAIKNFLGRKELRVSESQLDEWAARNGYTGMLHDAI